MAPESYPELHLLLVDDDPDYALAETLADSLQVPVSMKHHRCYSCFRFGASCSELK